MAEKKTVYQFWLRALQGGLKTATRLLGHLEALGVDYVWLSPIYPSPGVDHGYDISDYYSIDPRFGSMADFDYFVSEAKKHGIGVMMDLVLHNTATDHPWFREHPEFYHWREAPEAGWENFFDHSDNVWALDEKTGKYYLHLFSEVQADLNWFPDGDAGGINLPLLYEYHKIVDFWVKQHGVAGFRLDAVQSLNKDTAHDATSALHGEQAPRIIEAVFDSAHGKDLYLMAEVFDPDFNATHIMDRYAGVVDGVMNMNVKSAVDAGPETRFYLGGRRDHFDAAVKRSAKCQNFVLDLENHDAPRFTSRSDWSHAEVLQRLFRDEVNTVCLYMGQELGLRNPSKAELPDGTMLELDAETRLNHRQGKSLDALRPLSRANARVPLSLESFVIQAREPHSPLYTTRAYAAAWRERSSDPHRTIN